MRRLARARPRRTTRVPAGSAVIRVLRALRASVLLWPPWRAETGSRRHSRVFAAIRVFLGSLMFQADSRRIGLEQNEEEHARTRKNARTYLRAGKREQGDEAWTPTGTDLLDHVIDSCRPHRSHQANAATPARILAAHGADPFPSAQIRSNLFSSPLWPARAAVANGSRGDRIRIRQAGHNRKARGWRESARSQAVTAVAELKDHAPSSQLQQLYRISGPGFP